MIKLDKVKEIERDYICNISMDNEYLSRELLEASFEITNNKIIVNSPSTTYCSITRNRTKFTKKDLLDLYSEVVKLAKLNKVVTSKKGGYKKFIIENFQKYEESMTYYNNLFDELIVSYKEIEKRGLHFGTKDDIKLELAQRLPIGLIPKEIIFAPVRFYMVNYRCRSQVTT